MCDPSLSSVRAGAVKHLFAPDSMVLVNACHPGVTTSPLLKNLGMASGWDAPEKSAANPLFLAMDASLEVRTGHSPAQSPPSKG